MTFTYTPGTPNATDTIPATQQPIQNNFLSINQQYGGPGAGLLGDHVPLTAGSNNGRHNQVGLVTQTLPASLSSGPILAAQAVTISSVNKDELWIVPTTGQASNIQLTNVRIGTGTSTGAAPGGGTFTSFWSFLPGGNIIMWGQVVYGAAGLITYPFTVTFPNSGFIQKCYTVTATLFANSGAFITNPCNINNLMKNQFVLQSNSSSSWGFYWTAIGN